MNALLRFLTLSLVFLNAACGSIESDEEADAGACTGDACSMADADDPDDRDAAGDCAALYDTCTSSAACCGDAVCVGSTGPSDPGLCEPIDDGACSSPASCVTDADCCAPTTCLAPQPGAAGVCG